MTCSEVKLSDNHPLGLSRLQGGGGKRRCTPPIFLRDSAHFFNVKFEI